MVPLRKLREAAGLSVEQLALRMAQPVYVVLDLERIPTFRGFEVLAAYLQALDFRLELTTIDARGVRHVLPTEP